MPKNRLRAARPALAFTVLAVVTFVGWSGLFQGSNGSSPAPAAASTKTVAVIRGQAARPQVQEYPRIIALGDSVMIGAADRLAARLGPGFSMNAKVGRQANEFVEIVQKLKREGHRPEAMIIQMGDNGPLYGEDMEAIQRATGGVGELFLVSDHAPVSWQRESNEALAEAAADWPHTTLIDWAPLAAAHENLLWDGIHLTPAGAALYTRLISRIVHETVPFPPQPAVADARPLK
jgi:hypothetical protein